MPNVQAIPAGKKDHASKDEVQEFQNYREGKDNLYEAGILDVPNPYDPTRGPKYAKTPRPEVTYGPLLATDPGQPDSISQPKVISRQPAVDKSELDKPSGRVVRSKGKGN